MFQVFKWVKGAKHVDTQSPIFWGQNKLFKPPRMLKRLQNDTICIGIGVYHPLGMFGGHFQLLSASSGAIGNFSQWGPCFWHFWGCHFGCFKMAFFGLRRIFAASITLKIHTNSLLKAKKVEKHLELDGASKIPQILPNFSYILAINFGFNSSWNVPKSTHALFFLNLGPVLRKAFTFLDKNEVGMTVQHNQKNHIFGQFWPSKN